MSDEQVKWVYTDDDGQNCRSGKRILKVTSRGNGKESAQIRIEEKLI